MPPKYPNATAQLLGNDGNAFMIIGLVSRALRQAGVPAATAKQEVATLMEAASYDQLLQRVMGLVHVV